MTTHRILQTLTIAQFFTLFIPQFDSLLYNFVLIKFFPMLFGIVSKISEAIFQENIFKTLRIGKKLFGPLVSETSYTGERLTKALYFIESKQKYVRLKVVSTDPRFAEDGKLSTVSQYARFVKWHTHSTNCDFSQNWLRRITTKWLPIERSRKMDTSWKCTEYPAGKRIGRWKLHYCTQAFWIRQLPGW